MVEITYEKKKYRFSTWSLVLFPIGTILLALGLYFGTEAWFGEQIHWFVASQTSWLLKLFGINVDIFPINPPVIFEGRTVWWRFAGDIPSSIYFTHDCSGFQAIAIFLALILFTPHSQDKEANKGIWRRKGISMGVSSLLFHVVNVLRMVIQLSLYHAGLPWDDIHYSISAASSIIAAVIIVLMNRWIPEFVIAIMAFGKSIGNVFKGMKNRPIQKEEDKPPDPHVPPKPLNFA
jgi:exosortase/archaeosortase family protein